MSIAKARKRVQESIEKAHQTYTAELMKRRLEYAKNGIIAFTEKRFADSAQEYETYLRILEEYKKAPVGGLSPNMFDQKKEMGEILLITAILWELVKLLDHTEKKNQDFVRNLEKFISFAKSMPFQGLCAESIRKYLANGRAVHTADFRNAYKMLGGQKCFIATALFDVTEESTIETLRVLRDERLKKNFYGRKFVALYYKKGPKLAKKTDRFPLIVRKGMGFSLDLLAKTIRLFE